MTDPVPTPAPALAVIIPHYNDSTRLGRCLEALATQDRTGVEVVVVDNGSTGRFAAELAALAAAHPWARVVTEPGKGAALARNRGVAETSAPWIAFLDADCLPGPGWLAEALRIASGDPGTVTGGHVGVFDETPAPRSGAQAFETVFAFDQAGYIARKGFSVTANLVASRAAFLATGPFRNELSEDLDWCRRATAAGFRLVYDPALAVRHPTRSDWAALCRKWERLTEEGFATHAGARPGPGGRLSWALRAVAMLPSILAHAPRVLAAPGLSPRDRVAALATLARLRFVRAGWMLRQAATGVPRLRPRSGNAETAQR